MRQIIAKWNTLKSFETTKIMQSMYLWFFLVPVLAKLLNKVETPLIFQYSGQQITFDFALPFSWYLFYFASLCFVTGNIIVALKCPQMHKQTKDFSDFINKGMNIPNLREFAEIIDGFKINKAPTYKLKPKIEEMVNGLDTIKEPDPAAKLSHSENLREYLTGNYWRLFKVTNNYDEASRAVASIAYIVGLLLIGYVAIENLVAVVGLVSGTIGSSS